MSRFEFERVDLAATSTPAHVISVKYSHDPAGQYEFFVPVLRLQTFKLRYCCGQLPVSTVVSAVAVFRLVDTLTPSRLQIVH